MDFKKIMFSSLSTLCGSEIQEICRSIVLYLSYHNENVFFLFLLIKYSGIPFSFTRFSVIIFFTSLVMKFILFTHYCCQLLYNTLALCYGFRENFTVDVVFCTNLTIFSI